MRSMRLLAVTLDALIDPLATRRVLAFALEATSYTRHSEHLVLETMS